MARYLIESSSLGNAKKVLDILKRSSSNDDVYVSNYGHIAEAELNASERERVSSLAVLHEDAQLSPFGRIADPSYWENASLNDVLKQISAPQAWEYSRGEGVTVAIIDSGVDATMQEFPQYKRGRGICLCYKDGPWRDARGHGTMTASIAAGTAALTDRYSGVAPHAKVFSCRTDFTLNDVFKLCDTLRKKLISSELDQPLVINCSYGWESCTAPQFTVAHPLVKLIKDLVSRGVVVVCAAGNNHDPAVCENCDPDADSPNTIWGINSLDEVICVGAVDWNEQNTKGIHSKSSRGPGQFTQSRSKPDCVAPCYGWVAWGNEYLGMKWWGTSGAAPLVTGLASLVLGRTKGALQPAEVKEVILQSCRKIGSAPTRLGCGIIDCIATMKCL